MTFEVAGKPDDHFISKAKGNLSMLKKHTETVGVKLFVGVVVDLGLFTSSSSSNFLLLTHPQPVGYLLAS